MRSCLCAYKARKFIDTTKRMAPSSTNKTLIETVSRLSDSESLKGLFHQHQEGNPLPSGDALSEIIQLARGILFPGYYGQSSVNRHTLPYHIGIDLERLHKLLFQQIMAGLCFADEDCDDDKDCPDDDNCLQRKAREITNQLIERLPEIRKILATDIEAAYNGDPAAVNFGEIISCYPVIKALVNYRIAHELHVLGVPLIPRMISELAHSETGIDIHPAATIGHHFTIDHGTGVVIGATCIIGDNVKLYQGVTLGALSFPLDENGNPIKGIPRHPILEDDVIVYSNATILGRITIGKGCVIGANIWITENVAPNTKIYKSFRDNSGTNLNGYGI